MLNDLTNRVIEQLDVDLLVDQNYLRFKFAVFSCSSMAFISMYPDATTNPKNILSGFPSFVII